MLQFTLDGNVYELEALGNGAGLYKHLNNEFGRALKSAATEVTFGSITRFYREGNVGGDVFYYDEETGNHINSLGLPNPGWRRYKKMRLVERLVALAKKYGKKIRISVSGALPGSPASDIIKVVSEIVGILTKIPGGADWIIIEINFSCPNTVDAGGHRHPVMAYDPLLVLHIVSGLYHAVQGRVILAFKFSPYDVKKNEDEAVRAELCQNIGRVSQGYPGPVEIVCGNTIGGQKLLKPDGSPALGVTNNIGGLAGKAVKPLNLDNVRYFREHLSRRFSIIGLGGVTCGQDVLDYVQAGANKVQLTGYVAKHSERVHGEILQELAPLAVAA